MKPKVIVLDIETCPIEAWTWGIWEQNVGLEMIKDDWSILAYAVKPVGGKPIYRDTGGRGVKKVRDDSVILLELWAMLDEADIVITQNGKAFDIKKINARMVSLGMPPYSPIRIVDTLLEAKKHFAFTSNKLAWLSRLTDERKSEHREFPGFELWKECLADNPRAWAEMKKYNVQDVVATEKLYYKLLPWMTGHPNMAMYADGEVIRCPKCASPDVHSRGYVHSQAGTYQRYCCQKCGGWARSRKNELPVEKRRKLLA